MEADGKENLLDYMDTVVYVVDRQDYELLYANRAALKCRGCADNAGKKCYQLISSQQIPCEWCPVSKLSDEDDYQGESYIRETDRWNRVRCHRISWDGHDAVIVYLTDITEQKKREDSLQKAQKIYESAAEGAGLTIWTYNLQTKQITIADNAYSRFNALNRGILQIENRTPQEVSRLLEEKDTGSFLEMYRRIDAGEPSACCEVWFRARQEHNEPHCERMSMTSVYDSEGKTVLAYGITQDITAQKIEEEKYNRIYKQVAKVNPYSLGTFHLNLTRNLCIDGQSEREAVLQQGAEGTADHYLKKNVEIISDAAVQKEYAQVFTRKNLLKEFRNGKTEIAAEYPVKAQDGRTVWVAGFINMAQNPASGDVEAVTYALDITRRKIEENVVARIAEEHYDHISVISPQRRTFTFIRTSGTGNTVMLMQEQDCDSVIRQIAENYVFPDDCRYFRQHAELDSLIRIMNVKNSSTFVFRSLDQEGNIRYKQVQYCWLDASRTEIMEVQTDITDAYRKQEQQLKKLSDALQMAEQANRAKTEFISRISHDIRTPISAITSMTGFAIQDIDHREMLLNDLNKIRTSNTFLLSLINDVLDISRIDSGKVTLNPEPYPFEEHSANIRNVLEPMCEEKGLHCVFEWRNANCGVIVADKVRINQITLNLLSNAVKYTPAGGTVSYISDSEDLPDNKVRFGFEIRDTGIGMSPEFQKIMFEPFSQEYDNPMRPKGISGTGLGLSIVHRMVELMNGSMTVESAPGKGTTIRCSIVFPDATRDPKYRNRLEDGEAAKEDTEQLSGKVLLAEDNEINMEIAIRIIESYGLTADTAVNGQEAVERFEKSAQGEYAAVLMDIQMPVMNGYDATMQIRKLKRADAKNVPIIAMTADAFNEARQKGIRAGMDEFVVKPIEPQKLKGILKAAMKK